MPVLRVVLLFVVALDRTTVFSFPQETPVGAGVTIIAPILGGSPEFTNVVG